ncbi:hypothetical protein C7974DRAFT_337079 [Boeremia exigua]|uniref:uncharacterized protein n=1 Tax=Boeremia exigua TaxID=749465 RepID=UPI001E8DAD09|nr:uncharacterized protein C7974DRAFT_337079 [Boeremia exigua]KAH6625283.1 hypothetical protein C7974DRAFT_337079 [Boeremia exigua]
MAEVEPQSIKSRIAALNLEKVHAPTPGARPTYSYDAVTVAKKKAPPPPPANRPPQLRAQTSNNPPLLDSASASRHYIGNQPDAEKAPPRVSPALPPRPPPRTTSQKSPALPPRKSSDRSVTRRESSESISTIASGVSTLSLGSVKTNGSNGSTLYQVRAPAYDPSKLPPLPPKKQEEQKSATREAMTSKRRVVSSRELPPQIKPSPPSLPSRPSLPPRQSTNASERSPERPVPALPGRPAVVNQTKRAIVPPPQRSALALGFNNKATVEPPPLPSSRPAPRPDAGVPPPVPMSSRPNLDAIMASKPKAGAVAQCLICRDFSGPDSHAAKFPRQQLPSSNVGYLADQLCGPFSSATDKARAIFTWLHHNVDYDTQSFFAGNIQPSTPEGTITNGLAVCEGYASLFAALALKAGLECLVISGASKGFGHAPMGPNDPVPPYQMTHAWNACRIDNGVWKLIDPCWGAGHIGCQLKNEGYKRAFSPQEFASSNIEFGMRHFPGDSSQQFREDGRILSYEEFMRDDAGGRVHVYGGAQTDHGLGERTFEPALLNIKVRDPNGPPVVRFQFASVCEHWDNARHGKGAPYVMLLSIGGVDGRKDEHRPFNTNGQVWWLDVPRAELGCAGQKVSVCAVTEFCKKDARGLTYEQWKNKTAYSCQFGGICMWQLV